MCTPSSFLLGENRGGGEGLPKKGELRQFVGLMGLGKKEGVVFLMGVLIPQCTLWRNDKGCINEEDNSLWLVLNIFL